MATFFAVAVVLNVTPPEQPLRIRDVTIERGPQLLLNANTLDPLIAYWDPRLQAELSSAVAWLREMAAGCILRAEIEAANPDQAFEQSFAAFQNISLAIELLTVKAVTLTGPMIRIVDLRHMAVFHSTWSSYRGGAATVQPQQQTVLTEIATVLSTWPTARVETALLEYDTALKSDDVRRQSIHAVVSVEALSGGGTSEALNYKVPLRAVWVIPTLKANKKEGFEKLHRAYHLRSKFVHGDWNRSTVLETERLIDELLASTAEGLLEFLYRIRDSRTTNFPALDGELFLS